MVIPSQALKEQREGVSTREYSRRVEISTTRSA